jgi:uracil-DNA glycosylase family protein
VSERDSGARSRGRAPRATRQRRLDQARKKSAGCRRCELWERGTQTVFGEGPANAVLMLVGEQPGDQEDKAGHPFVGPAGKVLDDALAEAGLAHVPRYVTNAVKHFNWEPRGKRRLHMKPNVSHLLACRFWLEEEIAAVAPRVIVALGATATRAVLGTGARVLRDRGRWLPSTLAPNVTVTVHPSSLLRAPTPEGRQEARRAFVEDLRQVAQRLKGEE